MIVAGVPGKLPIVDADGGFTLKARSMPTSPDPFIPNSSGDPVPPLPGEEEIFHDAQSEHNSI